MKVGVLTVLYQDLPLEEALDRIAALGVRTVELATGNYVGNAHADPDELAERATAAWTEAGLQRITLHECRHTFASMLMAAGYTIKEIMVFMGHADVQTVQRYIKLLPQRDERNPVDRLDSYLRPTPA
jgi:integrase